MIYPKSRQFSDIGMKFYGNTRKSSKYVKELINMEQMKLIHTR